MKQIHVYHVTYLQGQTRADVLGIDPANADAFTVDVGDLKNHPLAFFHITWTAYALQGIVAGHYAPEDHWSIHSVKVEPYDKPERRPRRAIDLVLLRETPWPTEVK